MWIFQSIADEDRKFIVLPGKDYVVGRRDCDIVIENDQSVSRKHATLRVTHPEANIANVHKPATLTLTDVSKFGTFVNNRKVKGQAKVLQSGDEIRFGTPKSIHTVVYQPLVVTTSCLDGPGKRDMHSLLCQVGGHISSEWRKDCSYLIMNSVTVTIKVVCALASQKPIVTVDYIRDLLRHLKGEMAERPEPESYLPPVTEQVIRPGVSFLPMVERCRVFLGMTFYFLCEKQFRKMNMAVELGGGVPILMDSAEGAELEAFLEDRTVVMVPAPSDMADKKAKDWVEKVKSYLKKKGKYPVQDAEVGYAVLYCSTDDYCNPDKSSAHLLSAPLPSQSLTQTGTLDSQIPSSTRLETSQRQPVFKKPAVASGSKGFSASVSTQEREGMSKKAEGRWEGDGGSGEDWKAFTVPESLEDTPKTKGRLTGRDRAGQEEPALISDSNTAAADSSLTQDQKPVSVKIESGITSTVSASSETALTSEVLFDSDKPSVVKIKKEEEMEVTDSKVVHLLDEEDDDVVAVRRPPPSRGKRKIQNISGDDDDDDPFNLIGKRSGRLPPAVKSQRVSISDEDEDDPFNFVNKRSKKSTSPKPVLQKGDASDKDEDDPLNKVQKRSKKSPSPVPATSRERKGRRSPSPAGQRSPSPASVSQSRTASRRSPSPKPISHAVSASTDIMEESGRQSTSLSHRSDEDSTQSAMLHNGNSVCTMSADYAVRSGFLSTHKPIKEQVAVNPRFEKEDIKAPAVLVEFDNLVRQQSRRGHANQNQSDIPAGFAKWEGKLVRNFKKFNKVKNAGADALPRIIGGRDLEEFCQSTNKVMDDWLKQMQEEETQRTEREKEAQDLFNWRPTARGRKGKR